MYRPESNPETHVLASVAVLAAGLLVMAVLTIGLYWPRIVAFFS